MLGFQVAQSTVSKYLMRCQNPPSQSWKTFLQNHAEAIAAIDMCVVPTLTFNLLFAVLVLGHGRRQLLWFEVTRHPTAEWLARQITEAFPWASAPAYLVRDNDRAYGHIFTSRVRAMGIRDRPISPRSPWQNGIAERLIGTVRRECLDRILIFGESHLRRVLASYAAYYNQTRTHLALQKDAPLRRTVQRSGSIVAIPILAGLHHQYVRIRFSERTGHLRRDAPAPDTFRLYGVLQSSAHALGITGRYAVASNHPTVWCHCRHSDLGWAASLLHPDMIFGKDGRNCVADCCCTAHTQLVNR